MIHSIPEHPLFTLQFTLREKKLANNRKGWYLLVSLTEESKFPPYFLEFPPEFSKTSMEYGRKKNANLSDVIRYACEKIHEYYEFARIEQGNDKFDEAFDINGKFVKAIVKQARKEFMSNLPRLNNL